MVKARARGITTPISTEVEVAVKMVKSRFDVAEIKSLVGELKILVHLGTHLNVVNLLGAVTKNIETGLFRIKFYERCVKTLRLTGNLMVIVEYCRNGNLKDFLVKNRSFFINDGYETPCEPGTMMSGTSKCQGTKSEKSLVKTLL